MPANIAGLIRAGGPRRFMRERAAEAARDAYRSEAELWLGVLEAARPQIETLEALPHDRLDRWSLLSIREFHRHIRALRLFVEGPPSADAVRAQTRERVRRFRARRKSNRS
jgi:hypothetical protein